VSYARHLFAYGTLQLDAVMRAVAGRAPGRRPAELRGFARSGLHGLVYPGVVRQRGASTPGTVFLHLSGAELVRLDRFEGPLYRRESAVVSLSNGTTLRAEVYVVGPAHRARLSMQPWDLGAFTSECSLGYVSACRSRATLRGGFCTDFPW